MNRIPKLLCAVPLIAIVALSGCAHSAQHVDLPGSGAVYEKEFLTWFVRYHQDQDRFIQPCAQKKASTRNFEISARKPTASTANVLRECEIGSPPGIKPIYQRPSHIRYGSEL